MMMMDHKAFFSAPKFEGPTWHIARFFSPVGHLWSEVTPTSSLQNSGTELSFRVVNPGPVFYPYALQHNLEMKKQAYESNRLAQHMARPQEQNQYQRWVIKFHFEMV